MTLRRSRTSKKDFSDEKTSDENSPLLSLRAVVLIVLAAGCGVLAVFYPTSAIGIGTAVVVLTLLNKTIGD